MRTHRGKVLAIAVMAMIGIQTLGGGISTLDATYKVASAASTTSKRKVAAPQITIKNRSATTATMKVSKVANASYYKIYRSYSKTRGYRYVGKTKTRNFKDTGLTSSKSYYYKSRAVVNAKNTSYGTPVKLQATLKKTKNLTASVSNGTVKLRWSKVSGATKYKVYRSLQKNCGYSYIGSTTGRSYTDKKVSAGKTYYYRVRAKKYTGILYNGVYSNKVRVKISETQQNNNTGSESQQNNNTGSESQQNNNTGSESQQNNNTSSGTQSEFMAEVLRLVNVERGKEGLSKLTTTSLLGDAANRRAVEIKQVFDHTRPNGTSCFTVLDEFNISYRTAGENIAYGYSTPQAVVTGWMNSEGHRRNIMSGNFGKVGIGCYYSNGTYYWTQLFTN